MKQKHTKAKKANRYNDWNAYQFRSGQPFAKYVNGITPVGIQKPAL